MGCGGSLEDSPCTLEQKEEMFTLAVKDMIVLCTSVGIKKVDKITEPKELEDVRSVLRAVETLPGAKPPASPRRGKTDQSLTSKAMSAAKSVKDRADKLVTGEVDALTKNLITLSKTLQTQLDEFCKSFNDFSSEVLVQMKGVVLKIFGLAVEKIPKAGVPVFELVRGASPYGPSEYECCKSDKVIDFFVINCRATVLEEFQKELGGNAKLTTLSQSWTKMMETFHALNTKIAKVNPSLKKPPLKLDISSYVYNQLIDQMAAAMSREESYQRNLKNRDSPSRALPTQRQNFDVCFNGSPDFNEFSTKKHFNLRLKSIGKE